MALWTGLGQAATVAQLVGADVGGLISMIMQAALTARRNRKDCEQLARRVLMIAELLLHLQEQDLEPEAVRPLAGLDDTLRDAHELVVSCQERRAVYQLVMAGRQAERFREVQSKIDSYLILFPVISHIGITRRLDRIYKALVQDDSTRRVEASPLSQLQCFPQEVAHDIAALAHGAQEFTRAEIVAATNDFALDTKIDSGGFGELYRGRLHDGREVAVKRIYNRDHEFRKELDFISRLRHVNIICLLGWCVTAVSKDKHLQATTVKKKKGLQLTKRRNEPEELLERLVVYEYMHNGTLYQHLHPRQGSSSLSPVTVSWKVRIHVLLGVSRAIEHLHCHAIIHHDIKSANILLDASWVPRLSDFGASHMASDKEYRVYGTPGYMDPEYFATGLVKLSSDLYSLGVVMLEILTGKTVFFWSGDENNRHILSMAIHIPIIEAGNLGKLLDKRPEPEPTPGQLRALEQVAQTAACCVKLEGKDRPAISDIVANLEMALELICRDKPGCS